MGASNSAASLIPLSKETERIMQQVDEERMTCLRCQTVNRPIINALPATVVAHEQQKPRKTRNVTYVFEGEGERHPEHRIQSMQQNEIGPHNLQARYDCDQEVARSNVEERK